MRSIGVLKNGGLKAAYASGLQHKNQNGRDEPGHHENLCVKIA
jgi:hypothetical protein